MFSKSLFAQNEFNVKYENPTSKLGEGLLKLNHRNKSEIQFYNDSQLNSRFNAWNPQEPSQKLYPKFYELDYGICDFICTEIGSNYYKVLINYEEEKYVPKTNGWSFISWKKLIENSYGVTRKKENRTKNHLRKKPSEDSEIIPLEIKTHENFCVIQLANDWINVQHDCIYATDEYMNFEGEPCANYIEKCGNEKIGWMRWKEEGNLLVGIYLQP